MFSWAFFDNKTMHEAMLPLNFRDAVREQIPGVDSFHSDDLDQLIELLYMEYSIKTSAEFKSRFVCAKQLIWTDEGTVEIDGCEAFEFNQMLIYVKEAKNFP